MATPPAVAGLSRRQLDRLGERIRSGITPDDRALLDDYRESFFETLLAVVFDLGRLGVGGVLGLRSGRRAAAA